MTLGRGSSTHYEWHRIGAGSVEPDRLRPNPTGRSQGSFEIADLVGRAIDRNDPAKDIMQTCSARGSGRRGTGARHLSIGVTPMRDGSIRKVIEE
jgi:hypothetical protein